MVGVLVDIHVGDLMAGVGPEGPVPGLARDGAGADPAIAWQDDAHESLSAIRAVCKSILASLR